VTAGALAWSAVCGALFLASGLVVAFSVKRAFFDTWRASVAVVAVVMIWICWALALGQLLGVFGWLRRGPLALAAVASAGAALALFRRRPPPARVRDAPATTSHGQPGQTVLMATTTVLVFLVAAIWIARTIIAVHRGINDPDSLSYHIPFAVTFAQTGFANQHLYSFPAQGDQFFPANDELLSAIALVLTRSIAFAAVKNLLFGGFVLVAAYALGKAFRAGVVSIAAAAIVLGLPVVAFSQPGEAVNDSLVLLSLLAALVFLAHARDRAAPYVLAMGCAGVAFGDKFSAVVPAVGVGVFTLVLLHRRVPTHRLRWAGACILMALALGGSWYLRNTIAYGNPVPPAHLAIGPLHLRLIDAPWKRYEVSVLPFLVHGRDLAVFARGLPQGLGPLVPVVGVLCAFGVVAGLWARGLFRRGLGALALLCLLGYLTTPGGAWGVSTGSPYIFVVNLHYAAPALMFAMGSAALALARWRGAWLLPLVGWAIVLTGINPGRRIAFWSPAMGGAGFVVLLVSSLGGGAVVLALTRPGGRRGAAPTALATAVVVVVGALMIAAQYPRLSSTDPVERWATSVSDVRIAAWIPDVAWLYGPGSTNRVVTLTRQDDGAPVAQDSCPAWMRAVQRGHFQFSAVMPGTEWYKWLMSDSAFRLVAKNDAAAVFRIVGRPDTRCPGQS